jgi:hypothetical protein
MKMCKLLILVVMTCFAFVGCTTIDRSQFDGDKKYDKFSSAVKSANSIGGLVMGVLKKWKLEKIHHY